MLTNLIFFNVKCFFFIKDLLLLSILTKHIVSLKKNKKFTCHSKQLATPLYFWKFIFPFFVRDKLLTNKLLFWIGFLFRFCTPKYIFVSITYFNLNFLLIRCYFRNYDSNVRFIDGWNHSYWGYLMNHTKVCLYQFLLTK